MDLIEQAVFTSAETDQSAGYQLVATSKGISDVNARELAVWGPSHDAMLRLYQQDTGHCIKCNQQDSAAGPAIGQPPVQKDGDDRHDDCAEKCVKGALLHWGAAALETFQNEKE